MRSPTCTFLQAINHFERSCSWGKYSRRLHLLRNKLVRYCTSLHLARNTSLGKEIPRVIFGLGREINRWLGVSAELSLTSSLSLVRGRPLMILHWRLIICWSCALISIRFHLPRTRKPIYRQDNGPLCNISVPVSVNFKLLQKATEADWLLKLTRLWIMYLICSILLPTPLVWYCDFMVQASRTIWELSILDVYGTWNNRSGLLKRAYNTAFSKSHYVTISFLARMDSVADGTI